MRRMLVLCVLILIQASANGRIVYVKSVATGLNNGTSWLNAYNSLATAVTNAIAGDTIKVAAGTYKPGTVATSLFNSKNNVILLGGYSTDSTITTRNWSLYPTILSGEIGNPQVFDNIETIIVCFNVNSSAAWDGFIVEAASKNAVVVAGNSQPAFTNIIFRNNYASSVNGVVLNCASSAPTFLNCIFYQNTAFYSKAFIYASQNSAPKFTNCLFTKNQMSDTASVMYFSQSNPVILNSSFFDNITTHTDGRSVITGINNTVVSITNSIFFHNMAAVDQFNVIYKQDSSELYLVNSTASVANSILQNYSIGTSVYAGQNPRFKDTADVDGPDNRFYTADDGLQLTNPCSPALNSGNNAAIAGITTDILGNPRIYNNQVVDLGPYELQAAVVTPLHTVYVKKTATGSNDGSSWANAFTDLQNALLYCSDTVKVAADTYFPSSQSNPKIAFNLQNRMIVLGGYPNTGNPTDNDRDPQVNITTLSGGLSASNKSFIVLQSKRNDSTSIIDGFVVREGGVPLFASVNRSGSVYVTSSSSPVLKKIKIFQNVEAPSIQCLLGSSPKFYDCLIDSNAVGAYIHSSTPLFKRCVFTRNKSITMLNTLSSTIMDSCLFMKNPEGIVTNMNNSNGTISNSRFINNGALDTGPDIYNDASSPTVYKCYFTDSSLADFGGAIRNLNQSAPVFRLCEFRNYRVQFSGGVMRNDNSNPQFISCIFADNRAGYNAGGGGAVAHNRNYSSPKFINCAASNNSASFGSFMYNERSFAEIINTSISKHFLVVNITNSGGVIWNTDSSRLTVKNSILWGNSFPGNNYPTTDIIDIPGPPANNSTTAISNSVTQVYGINGVNGNLVGVNPRMFEYNDADGLDNVFFTADDGMKLTPCSPALNTGDNSAITEPLDILSNPRISGSIVDMGAYEYQNTPGGVPNVYFVNAAATGNNTGTSWANAYTNLWSAINNICADTVKVAAGTYKPAVTSRDSSFLLLHGKIYLGGYPATGNPGDGNRNPLLYPTILSGNIGVLSDSTDNTRHVVFMNNSDGGITMDGFTVSEGQSEQFTNPPPLVPIFSGGAILSVSSRTTLINCTIKNNFAAIGGGISILTSPKLKISKTLIQNNRCAGFGGGMYIQTTTLEKALVENSVIANNSCSSGGSGGGVYVNSDVSFFALGVDFNNILFYANDGPNGGGGMHLQSPYKVSVTNCNFINNTCGAISRGAGLKNVFVFGQDQGYPLVTNCLFKGNSFTDENILGFDIYDSDCPTYNCFRTNVNYTRVQTYGTGGGGVNNTSLAPQFINSSDPDGADNVWMTPDDGFAQSACSVLNDRGNNAAVAQIPVDITGKPRITNSIVDLGSYESQGALVTITASDTLVCTGATVVFTAHPVNGGTNPAYQWQVNGVNAGTNSNTFSSAALNDNDQVKVIMTSNETCLPGVMVTSNIITIHISGNVVPSVTISSPQNTICSGSSLTFTATPVNGGTNPAYQWQVNGINAGTNSPVFTTSALTNNSQVKVIMTSNLPCASPASATSNIITITVNPVVTPSVTINASASVICAGTNVSFTATPVNGGASPSYQWKRNGLNVGTNSNSYSSAALTNNDVISVVMTSNAPCASITTVTSNSITMTVNSNVAPSVTITGTTVVAQGSSTLITATPGNGGTNPGYQWQDSTSTHTWQNISGAVNVTINYTPALTGDKLRCVLTSNANCATPVTATSNALSFTVNTVTAINPEPAANFGIIYYPNPVDRTLTIDSLKISDKWQTLDIIAVDGKQLLVSMSINNRTRITVNTERLAKGFYIAVLRRKQGIAVYLKFIKQ